MKSRKYRYFMGDFETTVYDGQTDTQVWASSVVELGGDDVKIFHSIAEQFQYFLKLSCNVVCYYHNLKFDGSFWLSYLLTDLHYKQALYKIGPNELDIRWQSIKEMPNKSVAYSISHMGQWYSIIIKINNHVIMLRDSLKLLPFSVKRIGDSFNTKHKKLEMEYKGFRYPGCSISDEEQEYIKNDVRVVQEALEIMFQEGHNKLTIGSCCLAEYKKILGYQTYTHYFPNIYNIELEESAHKYKNAGDWIRKAYRGGWCYLAKGKEGKTYMNGITLDVNSLYPSMMSSESNNRYPIGEPTFWVGNYIPDIALQPDKYYFVRIKTRFYLKEGMLPCIQVKNTLKYKATEMLETSDILNPNDNKYYTEYIDFDGSTQQATVELVLTMTDYELIKEHYNLVDCEILDGCYFSSAVGIFDEYIEKYKQIKLNSKGALRELAKLFLNNLYGKMASSKESSFKVCYEKEDKTLGMYIVPASDKEPGYIPVGAAITSYSRNFTIRAAQKNYYGKNKPGFIYADTDSIHCNLPLNEIKGIKLHDKNFVAGNVKECGIGQYLRDKKHI